MGILASGIVISKFKPRARYLAGWNVLVEALEVAAHCLYGFLTCPVNDFQGTMKPDLSWDLTSDCNVNCDCGPDMDYSPICSSDGTKSFFTPCHAGCTDMEFINGTKRYSGCTCIEPDGWAMEGICPVDCGTKFAIFLVIKCIMSFLSASGKAGNLILQFRCVSEEDKPVSIGFAEVLMCAFAFIPGPIVSGMLLDTSCMIWGKTCGKNGNCWLYDSRKLGFLLNFTASAMVLCGTLLDVGVWYYAKDLQIYDEPTEEKEEGSNENIGYITN